MQAKKIIGLMTAGACLIGMTLEAQAQVRGKPEPSFYVGVGAGYAKGDFGDDFNEAGFTDKITEAGIGVTVTSVDSDETDVAYKIFGGYRFNPYFGIEGGWGRFGKFRVSGDANPGVPVEIDGTYRVYSFYAALLGRVPLGAFSLHGKVGAAFSNTELELKNDFNDSKETLDSKSTSLYWAIGASYHFSPEFALMAEYENFGTIGDSASGESGEMDLDVFSLNAVMSF